MESVKNRKKTIRNDIAQVLEGLTSEEVSEKTTSITERLCGFANFLEAKMVLIYLARANEVSTMGIIEKCLLYDKIVVIPTFGTDTFDIKLFKIGNIDSDLKTGANGVLEVDVKKCKVVSIEFVNIAIIPGLVFDEKGGRAGEGDGYYDRLIPKLPNTTRKVALAFENQVVAQVPMESHDKQVDIIITNKRIIYKI